ncbi:MAG: hypothetical protein PHD43_05190 [Methylococcales bacterium]|nr:hypothetical protein [Methylococcales bacterium]
MEAHPSELLLIAFVAMLAPFLAELPSGFRLPVVVLEVIMGILSLFVAMICMFFFNVIGLIQTPPVLAAVSLSTTALGVLAPILRDRGELNSAFGTYMVAAAAAGEFGPLMIISLLLIPTHDTFLHTLFIVTFIIIALVAANIALDARSSRLIEMRPQPPSAHRTVHTGPDTAPHIIPTQY